MTFPRSSSSLTFSRFSILPPRIPIPEIPTSKLVTFQLFNVLPPHSNDYPNNYLTCAEDPCYFSVCSPIYSPADFSILRLPKPLLYVPHSLSPMESYALQAPTP